jgi:2TM domain
MSNEDEVVGSSADQQLRERAVKRLRARAGFWTHLLIYLTVNTFIVVIWAVTSGGFFWPVFLIVPWGIGLIANAWDAFGPDLVSEDRVQREIERMRR